MSDESNKILQKLGDELGHITLIADWVERTKKELAEGTLQVGGTLTGHGAPPALAPAEEPAAPAPVVPAPATEPAPAAPAEGNADSASSKEGSAQENAAPAASGSEAPAEKEAVGDGNTAPPATSAPSEAAAAPAQDVAPPADATSAG